MMPFIAKQAIAVVVVARVSVAATVAPAIVACFTATSASYLIHNLADLSLTLLVKLAYSMIEACVCILLAKLTTDDDTTLNKYG